MNGQLNDAQMEFDPDRTERVTYRVGCPYCAGYEMQFSTLDAARADASDHADRFFHRVYLSRWAVLPIEEWYRERRPARPAKSAPSPSGEAGA